MKEILVKYRAVAQLIMGILIFGIIAQAGLLIAGIWYKPFFEKALYYDIGLWIGVIMATAYAVHMYRSIDRALDFDSETATKLVRKDSAIRYISLVLILGGLMFLDIVSPLTAFLGVMGLKAGAYMNGLCYKIMVIFIGEEPRKPLVNFDEESEEVLEDGDSQ